MFQPALPISGLEGWRFLQRTYDSQFQAFTESVTLKRDTDYFRENISSITTGEELVNDRRMLTVALGAFGLQDDVNNKFFIQRMLDDGTTNDDALANKFVDARYKEFSEAFGFGPGEIPKTLFSGFADNIVDRFHRQSFEVAVGEQDQTLRVALAAEREIGEMASEDGSERQNWFLMMGKPAMRELFQTSLGLPSSMSQIDIDKQVEIFADRSSSVFGVSDPAAFAAPELQNRLLSRYTALSQINSFNAGFSSNQVALTLLSSNI